VASFNSPWIDVATLLCTRFRLFIFRKLTELNHEHLPTMATDPQDLTPTEVPIVLEDESFTEVSKKLAL